MNSSSVDVEAISGDMAVTLLILQMRKLKKSVITA